MNLRSLSALLVVVLLASGCENGQELKKGKLEFAFESSAASGKTSSQENLRFVVITVQDESGNAVYTREKIELFKFGESYLSEPVEFLSGHYLLTEFFVLDDESNVQYATPLEGSRLAHLVADPLPINFEITEDETTKVTPEVIDIDEFTAEDFGYTTFSFGIVETLSFQLAVFTYNEATDNFELTSSHVSVATGEETLYNQDLPDSTIRVVVKDGFDMYTVHIDKPGYNSYDQSFSKDSLMHYHSGSVLKVVLSSGDGSVLEGLVGYYPFNGNANDESEYDHHGSVFGATLTTDRKGNANSAYYFDGVNDYISIADNDPMDFATTQDFTVSVWAYVRSPQADPTGGIFDIIRKWNGQNANGYPYSISYLNQASTQPNKFIIVRYDGQICQNIPTMYSPTVSTEGWYHIVMIKAGSRMKFYLDNQLVADIEDTTSCTTSNDIHITIGTRGQLIRFFTGKIDDIRFYNRAISSAEIGILFNE